MNTVGLVACPVCQTPIQAIVFPALVRGPQAVAVAERVAGEIESDCFYHPNKKAIILCEYCGRFLCALCDVELNNQHLCPTCIETGAKKERIVDLQRQRFLYDSLALSVAGLPLLMWPVTLLTAPAALYIAIRYWKKPTSIVGRTKTRMILAILLATLQLAGWIFLGTILVARNL